MNKISVIIAASCTDYLIIEDAIKSVLWADEVIVSLTGIHCDKLRKILIRYKLTIFKCQNNLGFQRNLGILNSRNQWVLILDTDEIVSKELAKEIKKLNFNKISYFGYKIPFVNYFLKNKIIFGNQKYSKLRLFNKKKGQIDNIRIHPNVRIENKIGQLKNPIHHYSFRPIPQTLKKFSYYASIEAPLLFKKGDRVNLKKLTMYPAHMFYAIFFKDHGYKDGIWGFGLAICFAIMEFLKYWYLMGIQIRKEILR